MSGKKNLALLAIFYTVFIDLVGVGIVVPIFAPLFLDAAGTMLESSKPLAERELLLGLMIGTFPLAQFLGAPILGALSDRYGRKKTLTASLAGTCAGYVLAALSVSQGSLPLLFIARFVSGFSGGNISIAMSAIADISDNKEKTRNFGLVGMAFGLGFIIGPYVGGKLSDPSVIPWFGYATPLWFASLLALLNIAIVSWKLPETLAQKGEADISLLAGFRNIRKAFMMPNLRTLFVVIFLINLGLNFFTQFFQVFLIERFHYTPGQIGDYFGYMGFWIALTQGVLVGPVSRRLSPDRSLRLFMLAAAFTYPLLLLPREAATIYLIVPAIAISQGIMRPNYTTEVSNLAGREVQGEIMGINQSVQSLSMALPPIVSGVIASIDMNLPIMVASLTTFLAWAAYVIGFDPRVRKRLRSIRAHHAM